MIKFNCEHCGQKLGVPDEHAGKRVRCTSCKEPARAPELEAPEDDPYALDDGGFDADDTTQTSGLDDALASLGDPASDDPLGGKTCPGCGKSCGDAAKICLGCGHRFDGRGPVKTKVKEAKETPAALAAGAGAAKAVGAPVMVLVAGGIAALAGGLVWAAIDRYLQMEVGWIAIGLGAIVGWAVSLAAGKPNVMHGVIAAGLATVGLAFGKVLAISWILSSGAALEELAQDEALVHDAVVYQLIQNDEASDDLEPWLLDQTSPEVPPDLEMRWAVASALAQDRMAGMSEDQQHAALGDFVNAIYGDISFTDKLKATLGPYDFLWFGLAVFVAFGAGSKNIFGED